MKKIFLTTLLIFPLFFPVSGGLFAADDTTQINLFVFFEATPTPAPTPFVGGGGGPITKDGIPPGIYNLVVAANYNQAAINWKTTEPSRSVLYWGETKEYELGSLSEIDYSEEHFTKIAELQPDTAYYFKIEFRDEAGNKNTTEPQKFTTLLLPDTIPPANVSGFAVSVFSDEALKLSWQNPPDADFRAARVVRSDKFFPLDVNEGEIVYEGRGTMFIDRDVLKDVRYYYTIFAYDASVNYSSGAVGTGIILTKPEVPIVPPGVGPEVPVPFPPEIIPEVPPELVPFSVQQIQLEDFEFSQGGKTLVFKDGRVEIGSDKPFSIEIKYEKVPEVLKTIMVTLTEPEGKTFSFLLKVDKEKTSYGATIAPLKKSGIYLVTITVLDYKNQALKKIKTSLFVQGASIIEGFEGYDWRKIWDSYYIYIMPAALLALVLLILYMVFRKKSKVKIQNAKLQSKIQKYE